MDADGAGEVWWAGEEAELSALAVDDESGPSVKPTGEIVGVKPRDLAGTESEFRGQAENELCSVICLGDGLGDCGVGCWSWWRDRSSGGSEMS